MKKLLLFSAVFIAGLAATQAGVDIRVNVGLPHVIIGRPGPRVVVGSHHRHHVPPPCPPPYYGRSHGHGVVVAPAPVVIIKAPKKHHRKFHCDSCERRRGHGESYGHGHGHGRSHGRNGHYAATQHGSRHCD